MPKAASGANKPVGIGDLRMAMRRRRGSVRSADGRLEGCLMELRGSVLRDNGGSSLHGIDDVRAR